MNAVATLNDSQTLLNCLEQVLMEWAFLSVDYLGDPASKPSRLPLERKVRLGGQNQATLVLRGSFGLGLELARSVRGLPAANLSTAEASFAELCALLAEEWKRRQLADNAMSMHVTALLNSSPETWPSPNPTAAIAATVRGLAIEVLLWTAPDSSSGH